MNIVPVILCGGSGTRLWPYSREQYPKQFLPLANKDTLFQNTMTRTNNISSPDYDIKSHIIVTNEDHRFLAQEQAKIIGFEPDILLEPLAKNTAPALTLAAFQAIDKYDKAILVVSPADHFIRSELDFIESLRSGIDKAINESIVVLGIEPSSPETGYGYIKIEESINENTNVLDFKEKPSLEMAVKYIEDKNYFWNSGMFIVDAALWLDAIKKLDISIYEESLRSWQNRKIDGLFVRFDKKSFENIPSNSIDYSVMEKSINAGYKVEMVKLRAGWDDLGSWDSIKKYQNKDKDNNYISGDSLLFESSNNLIHSTSNRIIAALGVDNLCIVDTPDALLIASSNKSQNVKEVVNQLKIQGRNEVSINRKAYRPWGWYDNIEEGEGFKVKRIGVNPGAVLSLQKHFKRSEHWVVIKGIAEVTCGESVFDLNENESTFIPIGEKHRLRNATEDPLEIIEVQLGSYLEEDDIVRFEDTYGRTSSD